MSLVVWGTWTLGKVGKTLDIEIWNGQVTGKERVHDHYERSYDCNCTTDEDGYETCMTCYEDRFTVTWRGYTTVGNFTFQHLDRGSRLVYQSPDPYLYVECKPGDPASIEHTYTNYIQAVEHTLYYRDKNIQTSHNIPEYPRVYDFYKVNRVLEIGSPDLNVSKSLINHELNVYLKQLGPKKEVNPILIFTDIQDRSLIYSLENKWEGFNKNDVVILISTLDGEHIEWVEVGSWAQGHGNHAFHGTIKRSLYNETIQERELTRLVASTIYEHYNRPHGSEFSYLEKYIQPELWVKILVMILSLGLSLGLSYFFHHNEM